MLSDSQEALQWQTSVGTHSPASSQRRWQIASAVGLDMTDAKAADAYAVHKRDREEQLTLESAATETRTAVLRTLLYISIFFSAGAKAVTGTACTY
jgi:hypothetical protein